MTDPSPHELLTPAEHAFVALIGQAANLLNKIIGDGPQKVNDWNELVAPLHVLQRTVGAQAAGRAFPGMYRLLGYDLDGPGPPPGPVDEPEFTVTRPAGHAPPVAHGSSSPVISVPDLGFVAKCDCGYEATSAATAVHAATVLAAHELESGGEPMRPPHPYLAPLDGVHLGCLACRAGEEDPVHDGMEWALLVDCRPSDGTDDPPDVDDDINDPTDLSSVVTVTDLDTGDPLDLEAIPVGHDDDGLEDPGAGGEGNPFAVPHAAFGEAAAERAAATWQARATLRAADGPSVTQSWLKHTYRPDNDGLCVYCQRPEAHPMHGEIGVPG